MLTTYLLGFSFGSLMICCVIVGMAAVAYGIASLLLWAFPILHSIIRGALGWEKYGATPVLRRRKADRQLPPAELLLKAVSTPHMRAHEPATALPLRQPPPKPVNDGNVRYMEPRICSSCGQERKVFTSGGMCLRCSPSTPAAMADRRNLATNHGI